MGNISCSPDDCYDPAFCIQDIAWIFIVHECLAAAATMILFIYGIYNLFIKHKHSKLSAKYKFLIVFCHSLFVVAAIAAPFYSWFIANCDSLSEGAVITFQLTLCYQYAACMLVLIFILRLYDAVKGSAWEFNNNLAILIISMILLQILSIMFLGIGYQFWDYDYGGRYFVAWMTVYFFERVLFFLSTILILYAFIKKFTSLINVTRETQKEKQKQLVFIVAKQMILVIVAQSSSIIQTFLWSLSNSNIKHGFYIASNIHSIDMVINCICLHSYFEHGYKLYQLFQCEKYTKALIKTKIIQVRLNATQATQDSDINVNTSEKTCKKHENANQDQMQT